MYGMIPIKSLVNNYKEIINLRDLLYNFILTVFFNSCVKKLPYKITSLKN